MVIEKGDLIKFTYTNVNRQTETVITTVMVVMDGGTVIMNNGTFSFDWKDFKIIGVCKEIDINWKEVV